ncbi:MAG: hypothetical protein UX09_C0025G0014 [Candidatus Uhrbacteria bacterium GW2011_GWE2_45_35]|uniref:Death domain-containing protein n=2 Tax=Candidatus Uhriibacteriota TaxID=1752732 RepID=A0A0G1MEH9_9BACT|nr:MAG: hypothetical protein UW63_C0028G0006 [Candidatus Uhrbacteria bacterium GW2011_GWF2_44_350]KKU07724.1 MAG: hypothetical protein UX09_C0025G0014 [Candidatus Uhrbacteria bacterium GW2011_GWE2_45_35]HBR80990.1 hypothetical protein [Candidatus Uhrbacteria bacterium]HCU31392.1 hypothetical protein [Candidatus Uhrbacteria bacterium]
MSHQLATFDISQIVAEKTRFITKVMQRDPEIAGSWSLEALLSVSAHVASSYAMRQDLMQDRAHAQAIILCFLNYALECLVAIKRAGGDRRSEMDLALAIARKVGIEQLIAYAETRQREICDQLRELRERDIVRVRSDSTKRWQYYGITDATTAYFMWSRSESDLFDPCNLPVATLAEEQAITDLITRVKEEITVAGWVNWSEMLSEDLLGVGVFAARYFRRVERHRLNPAGGVLYPFLMGLLVKAFGNGIGFSGRAGSGCPFAAEIYVFGNLDDVISFLERVVERRVPGLKRWQRLADEDATLPPSVFPDQDLGEIHEAEVAAKIARVTEGRDQDFCDGRIFSRLNHRQTLRVANLGLQAFRRLVESARNFYHFDEGQTMPEPNRILEFWCDHVFMSVQGNTRLILAETWARRNEPWRHDPNKVVSLADLLRLAEGFAVWPEAAKEQLVETVPINRILTDKSQSWDDKARVLLEVWGFMTRDEHNLVYVLKLMNRVDWDSFRNLFKELCSDSIFFQFKEVMLQAARVMTWSHRLLLEVLSLALAGEILPIALPKVADSLSTTSWESVIARTDYRLVGIVWQLLDGERLVELFDRFDARNIGQFLNRTAKLEELPAFFRPLLEALRNNENRRDTFSNWARSGSHRHGLELFRGHEVVLETLWTEIFPGQHLRLSRN